jgi:ribose 5-phosphate isomerase B
MAKKKKTVCLGSDHAGFELKEAVARYLRRAGYEVSDHGAFSAEPSDYPDFVIPAAEEVARSRSRSAGIVFGGSGIGECIAANKVRGVRAALAYDAYTARMSRLHNDANVLCLGGRTVTGKHATALRIVKVWMDTPFSGEARHVRRLKKIAKYETGSRRR